MSRRQTFALLLIVLLILPANLTFAQVEKGLPAGPSASGEPLSRGTGFASDAEPALSGVPADWWLTVQEDIRRSEYDVTWQDATYPPDGAAAYQAPNRAQGIRTYFTPTGIRVIPRTGGTPSWELGLALAGYVPDGPAHVSANRYGTANRRISEWYVNGEGGLEMGWALDTPLRFAERGRGGGERGGGGRILTLAFTTTLTPRLTPDDTAVEFANDAEAVVLRYGPFSARNAAGRPVPLRLRLSDTTLAIQIPTSNTHYPLTIRTILTGAGPTPDGLSSTPNWITEGDQADGYMGWSVGLAGDANGDGYSDVIVGAFNYDNGEADEGRAYVFYGSALGLNLTPDWVDEGNQVGAFFGRVGSTAGDVNGDGYSDVIVGAPLYDNGESDEGRAYVYHGSPSGLNLTPNWTTEGDQSGACFGGAISTAGDVNGDGYSDVVIGAYEYDNGETDEGKAYVYHGSPGGLSSTANWTAESNQADANFGSAVNTAGDVNGDGYADVIVGAWRYTNGQNQEGRAFVFLGSSSGLSSTPVWTAEGNQTGAFFGESAGTAGDVNGDGYTDVIVGARNYTNGEISEGAAFVYYGSPSGPGASPGWMADGNQSESGWGFAVGTAGDVNGDGYADVIVGAPYYDSGEVDRGRASVYHGSATGLGAAPDWVAGGTCASAFFGISVGTAGDVNGDGYADIIVGALQSEGGLAYAGAAYAYHGSPAGLGPNPGWTAESDQAGAWFEVVVDTAGDVNGDGYADVVVGARRYDNGQVDEGQAYLYYGASAGLSPSPGWTADGNQNNAGFGSSVGAAGDVNGDGYSDVLVGAHYYDNGEVDEGRAYLFHGSAAGLSSTANWMAESDRPSAEFGYSVDTAGDVNGDGYADVIIGAGYYDNCSAGMNFASVYHGSAAGLSASADWTVESTQACDGFGRSASTAGDVDGDGYGDVVVGAWRYDNGQDDEGRAYLYDGSAAGLSLSPSWTAESDQAGAYFGLPVGTAGDVNGDGWADVIVGSSYYDNGLGDEGRAYVYHGSVSGLSGAANWVVESNSAGSLFGLSAGTAGDVNGDGYADVVVGALHYSNGQTGEGSAYAYYGAAAGLSPVPNWMIEGNQEWARLGVAVSTAGDVNGDGYADVIVGADWYDNGQIDEGKAWVYYGNGGVGLSLIPRQRRSDDSAPIAPLGMADSNAFRLALLGRTPFGRAKVKLEWEVKPLGTLFDGSDTQASNNWMDTGTAGVQISELVDSLSALSPYHWRVRLLYHPATTPFQRNGRWLTMPWNGWNEADLRAGDEPVAGLSAANDSPTALGQPTHLTATIAAGSNVVYAWALGDGTTGAGPLLAHTYAAAGTYTALVTASNAVSAITATTVVTVEETITGLVAANDSPTALGQPTYLTATVAAGSNVIYAWTLGDGATGAGPTLSHTYLAAGTYTALVIASNAVSAITATTVVTVEETIAGLAAANDSPTPLGSLTHLTATVAAGSNVLYSWALGDGTGGAGPLLAHTYLAAGTYTALVTATNAVGAITATTTVQIGAAGPHTVCLPVVYRAYFLNPYEPNDSPTQAWGPLEPAQAYASLPDDADDWFYVEMGTAGDLRAVVTGYSAQGNLLLYVIGPKNWTTC